MDIITTIQSSNRSSNVDLMQKALGKINPIWIVPEIEYNNYVKAGAKQVLTVSGDMPLKTKQLNLALNIGKKENKIVLTLDDDYEYSQLVYEENTKKKTKDISLYDLIDNLVYKFNKSEYKLAGISSTTNPFFKSRELQNYGMLLGAIMFHKPTDIRFDESLKFLEDMDYIIQHHIEYGGIYRYNYYIASFHIFGRSEKENAKHQGGYKNYRSNEEQIKIFRYLEEKYNTEYIKFSDNNVGDTLTKKVKWKKLKEINETNSLERFI